MPGGMPGGFPGAMPGAMPGNIDMSTILNVRMRFILLYLHYYNKDLA